MYLIVFSPRKSAADSKSEHNSQVKSNSYPKLGFITWFFVCFGVFHSRITNQLQFNSDRVVSCGIAKVSERFLSAFCIWSFCEWKNNYICKNNSNLEKVSSVKENFVNFPWLGEKISFDCEKSRLTVYESENPWIVDGCQSSRRRFSATR